jgi:hypothetical protein
MDMIVKLIAESSAAEHVWCKAEDPSEEYGF